METPFIREVQNNGQPVGLSVGADTLWAGGLGPVLTDSNGAMYRLVMQSNGQGGFQLGVQPITYLGETATLADAG